MFSKFINYLKEAERRARPRFLRFLGASVSQWWKSIPVFSKLARHRIIRIGIIVKPFARFTPVPAGHDQSLKQWRRCEPPFFELVIHHMRDVVGGVEPDKVQKRERSHGIPA